MRVLSNVAPTPEQLQILADAGPGFRLIRGAAGSGKTTTALLRLRQLCASRIARKNQTGSKEPIRVLVLTFNRTLRGYVMQLANEQIQFQDALDITVDTFAHWALKTSSLRARIPNDSGDSRVRALLRCIGVRPEIIEYFVDEVRYITGRFQPEMLQDYIQTERTGRGRVPVVNQQIRTRLLDEVIAPYEEQKRKENFVDWNDLALSAANAPSQRYDVVVADETQDFSANQLRAILAHLDSNHSTTFIMDAAQRIYPQSFSWREIGVEMRPQMVSTLERNYRNSAEIAALAASLLRGIPADEDGVLPDARACEQSGRKPEVVAGLFSNQVDYMLNHVQPFLDAGESVAFLHTRGWFNFVKQTLRQRNIAYCELTQKRDWPTGPELVALSTIHSAKGLEFDHVLMPGLSHEVTPHGVEDGDGTLDSLRRLVAMGIGRARRTVTMGYKPGEESTLIGLLDPATYDFVEV